MRIAHRHTGDARIEAACSKRALRVVDIAWQRLIDDPRPRQRGRNALAFEDWLAHVNAHAHRLAALRLDFEREDAAPGLDGQRRLRGDAVVVDVFRDTADAVAAHLRL